MKLYKLKFCETTNKNIFLAGIIIKIIILRDSIMRVSE